MAWVQISMRHVAVAGQVQVGVMVLRLRDLADAVEEVEPGEEVLDAPFAADASCRPPSASSRARLQVVAHLLRRQGGMPPSQGLQCLWVNSVAVVVMAASEKRKGRVRGSFYSFSAGSENRR